MDIYLARTVEDFEVISTDGVDLGRPAKTRRVWRSRVSCWCSGGTNADLVQAKNHAHQSEPAHGWRVLIAPEDMPSADHMKWAHAEIVRLDAEKNAAHEAAEAAGSGA